ncbi:MAG: class I SAM-dependent rRNA methyltransferase [Ignavibacteriaceae bacterium]|nr:class I SAM-dependent rRNA methyltransferase [Ignavibacteriaceae bacterium]
MSYPKAILKHKEDRRIKAGHQWVFSNEIHSVEGTPAPGEIVQVFNASGHSLGYGFYNNNSLIAVRMMDESFQGNLEDYFRTKILSAYELRKSCYPNRDSFRLVFSESDRLPGLIIDKYNLTFVMQVNSAGMEKNIGIITSILVNDLGAQNIFTRNEKYFRELEHLNINDTVYHGAEGIEIISDGTIRYEIDFSNSQKTGFYFDQCDNRSFIRKFCGSKKVLDAFCNQGGFGLNAVYGLAEDVVFVDSSRTELQKAQNNFNLNGFQTEHAFIESDVFDFLEACAQRGETYDVIIIDPPAFAKNKKSKFSALKGYEKLNRMALSILRKPGILVTSSCSYHISKEELFEAVGIAGNKLKKNLRLIYYNGASLDHPVLPAMPETSYLKFAVYFNI